MKNEPFVFDADKDFEWYEAVDSTNRLAREYASREEFSKAKAFAAAAQSAGVGRQGRGWISENGNLHLSIAIPGSEISKDLREVLPLAVGVVVSKWVEAQFNISPVLKWPNDIVICGFKIGGILCEATALGASLKAVCVGIGINLNQAVLLNSEDSYFSNSLKQLTNINSDPKKCSLNLAQMLLQVLRTSSHIEIMKEYRRIATQENQVWIDGSRRIYRQLPFAEGGALRLLDLDGRVVTTSSAENSYSWSGLSKIPCVFADIGNTRTKLALVARSEEQFRIASTFGNKESESTDEDLEIWLDWCIAQGSLPILRYLSVSTGAESRFISKVTSYGWQCTPIAKNPCRLLKSRYQLDLLGIDRFACIEGALSLPKENFPNSTMMIVCLGTATTVDFISSDQKHLGGFIGPGVNSSLTGLLQAAPALPKVSPGLTCTKEILPTETNTAISASSIRMQLGWIEFEVKAFADTQNVNSKDVWVIFTGGYSRQMFEAFKHNAKIPNASWEPDLIFKGAAIVGLTRG